MNNPKCHNCETPVYNLADKFCRNCATDLTGQHSKCNGCGFSAIINEEIKYCPMCGFKHAWPSAQAPA